MNIAIYTTICDDYDKNSVIISNRNNYVSKHKYSLILDHKISTEIENISNIQFLLDCYDMIWYLSIDTLITNMKFKIEHISDLGPHITVCEENIVPWQHISHQSIVFKNTKDTKTILKTMKNNEKNWKNLPNTWATWLYAIKDDLGDILKIAPSRSFNSCIWDNHNHKVFSDWKKGDFVCNLGKITSSKTALINNILKQII